MRTVNFTVTWSIIRHTVDLAAIAIILAAIKKQTGYTLSFGPNNEFNHLAKMYTSLGSYMYEKMLGWVRRSSYFKKTNIVEDFADNVSKTFTQLGTDVTDNVVRPTQLECD
ncbi:hypothetical protein ACO0RG_003835 [Hanseniaspora osmophila]|uniref:Uncharacterized protein n=1 Tax=Hanseniaspora osmophila TaxID=56408 RepID=A0A1E5RBD9_9ASCO|nr:hypothetical protein AWRI3579_g2472 [Hanseniaspora osmophila]